MSNQRITIRDVAISIGSSIVGGVESLSFSVKRDGTFAYEGNNYFPVEIVDGKIEITGEIERAYIDAELINLICPSNQSIWPSFTITGVITSGKTPGRTATLIGCKFDSFDVNGLGQDGYAKNKLPFKALNWKISE